jgi:hypothetical protein
MKIIRTPKSLLTTETGTAIAGLVSLSRDPGVRGENSHRRVRHLDDEEGSSDRAIEIRSKERHLCPVKVNAGRRLGVRLQESGSPPGSRISNITWGHGPVNPAGKLGM